MTRWLSLLLLLAGGAAAMPQEGPDRRRERALMVLGIENLAAVVGGGAPTRIDPNVLRVMAEVPRHLFVPEALAGQAYRNQALPIGHDVTISQPYIVALMTDLADIRRGDVVLEVGTGSGYQAAVLSRLAARVYSVEIIAPLAESAAERLARLGYANVTVRAGDGYAGWPEHAPFDRIVVTAGADHVPQPLVDQLRPGGRMVIPVGRTAAEQKLVVVDKDRRGEVRRRTLLPVSFVPLTRAKAG